MQLFETNTSPKDVAIAPIVEVIRVSITDAESSKTAEQVWKRISKFLEEGHERNVTLAYGKSLNLEGYVIVGILGWVSAEVRLANLGIFLSLEFEMFADIDQQRSKVSQETEFTEALTSLKSLGDVSQIIVDVAPIDIPAL